MVRGQRKPGPVGVVLLALALLLAGCDRLPYRGGSYERPVTNHPSSEDLLRLREIDWQAVPELVLKPAWEKAYDQVIAASLAEDGETVAASMSLTVGRSTGLGYELFDVGGNVQTRVVFTGDYYRAASVWLVGEGRWLAATMNNFDQQGYFAVYDHQGKRVLARSLKGWAIAAAARAGTQLAIVLQPLGQTYGQLCLYDTGQWREVTSFRVRADAVVQFSREGGLLVADADRILLVSDQGKILAEYRVPSQFRRVVLLSPSGRLVAATTGEADSRVYVFDQEAELLFEGLLFYGGTNRLAFSGDERWLAVYDVGERGGIYLFAADTGHLVWRSLFRAPEGKTIRVHNLAVDHVAHRVVAEIVVWAPGSPPVEDHHVYVATLDGVPQFRIPLGENLDVHLDATGRVAIVTTNNLADWSGRVRNHLRWYDLASPSLADIGPQ